MYAALYFHIILVVGLTVCPAVYSPAGEHAEQTVNPWEVNAEGGIDYDKLVVSFGCSRIKEDMISRIERLTGRRAHRFLRRGLFYTHRCAALRQL